MALSAVNIGDPINASTINQVIYALQRLAGQQEVGHYFIAYGAYANTSLVTGYFYSISRGSVPVSASIDTTDGTGGLASVTYGSLTANGAQIWSHSTGIGTTGNYAGGNFTIQY